MTFIQRLYNRLIPPVKWQIPVAILLGGFVGISFTAFYISNAASYMSNDPRACINCHVMTTQYATWLHSSHRETATCNDCHVPHDNFIRKMLFKAQDGMRHASIFTLRMEPQVIHIKEAGKFVVQENCKRCHEKQINQVSIINVTSKNHETGEGQLCWNCHRETPHGRTNSQSSTPNAMVPPLKPVLPEWLNSK